MTTQLTEEEVRKVRTILEHEGLDAFLPYADLAAADLKLSSAKKLIWKTYRQIFVSFVALVVAFATFWDKLTSGLGGLFKWVAG